METYLRVLWPEQRDLVVQNYVIPTNHQDWKRADGQIYAPGTVVFLMTWRDGLLNTFCRFAASQGKEEGSETIVMFDAEIAVENDMTGWGILGAVVHHGEVDLNLAKNVHFVEIEQDPVIIESKLRELYANKFV